MKKSITLLFVSFINICFGQSVSEKFQSYQESHHLEKIYINHDKSFYTPGDTIWSKVYFVDGRTHQFFEDAAPIIHVEWRDTQNKLKNEWLLKIEKGIAAFEVPLPYDIEPGKYTLKAYTTYQRNFAAEYIFQKNIDIISDSTQEEADFKKDDDPLKFNIQFLPEGGNIVSGINNNIAFKATNENGEDINIKGELIDDSGNTIQSFRSYHQGMGSFKLKPDYGSSYKVKARYNDVEKSFELPKFKSQGYTIHVDSKNKAFIAVQIESNTPQKLKGASLLVHVRGVPVFNHSFDKKASEKLTIPKTEIPDGVVHFTLFDNKNRPICERLVFNKNPSSTLNMDIKIDKESYQKREKINVILDSNQSKNGTEANISLSVYNADLYPDLSSDITIENYLLLQSDLVGKINNINQYFTSNSPRMNYFLDLIMMTHGWRRFTWTDVLEEDQPSMEYGTEEDISIVGIVRKKGKEEGIKADVLVNTINADGFSNVRVTTNEKGVFYLKGYEFQDTVNLVIQANEFNSKNQKKKNANDVRREGNKNVEIEILTLERHSFNPSLSLLQFRNKSSGQNELITNYKESRKLDSLYNPTWAIEIDEFLVKGQRKTKKEEKLEALKTKLTERGMFYFPSSQKIFLDDLPGGGYHYNNIFDIMRGRAPGVEKKSKLVNGALIHYFVIRGTTNIAGDIPALLQMDGLKIDRPQDLSINPDNILAIDIIKGLSATSVFGEAGAGGVVNIITKDPSDQKPLNRKKVAKGTLTLKHPGFYNAKEYYSPNYAVRSIDHQKPDLRTTLFWASNINIDGSEQDIQFYSGDKTGRYTVKAEGISAEGLPFVRTKTFRVVEGL